MEVEEIEGLGKGIQFPDQYRFALAQHKATDMKHDKLTLGENGSFWGHYYKFIPSSIVGVIKAKEKPGKKDDFFTTLSDNNFMEMYIHGDDTVRGPTVRPIKSMLDMILYCTGETDISKLNNRFGEESNGLATKNGEFKNIYVKFGDNLVYSYSARLQNLNFSKRRDDPGNRDRTVEPTVMLNNLKIVSGSALNVDFQYHLWDLLKSGRSAPEYKIYLLMNPENINDPAGKYNMNDAIFKKSEGVSALLTKCITGENTSYSSFDSRIPNEAGADFFSRFDVVISEIKTISNMCGLIKSTGVELTIKSKPDNFFYSEISKANNSNAVVKGELSKYYVKYNKVPKTSAKMRDDLELLMAAEAAKKGGGDDLQLLSHWHVYNRVYEIVNPVLKITEEKNSFKISENKVFFVSHDGPTIVRALIEGDSVLFMYSQVIGGNKYECAISLIRGEVTQPPLYRTIQQKYEYIQYKFIEGPKKSIYDKISQMNENRERILNSKAEDFNTACVSLISTKKTGNVEYVTNLLNAAVTLCLLRNSLCKIESVIDGICVAAYDFYEEKKDSLHEIILSLTDASGEDDFNKISLVLKTLEDKNRLVIEEESKYDERGNITSIFQKRLDSSPEFIATKNWSRVQRTSRGNEGIVNNQVLYELYFEIFSKWFTEEESRAFIDSLNKAAVKFSSSDPVLQNVKELLSYAITRLDTYKSINSSGEKIKMTIADISDKDVTSIVKIAELQKGFTESNILEDISNFEDTKNETRDERFGGARIRTLTPLFSTNDRGLPYSPCVSYLSNNLHAALKNEDVFTESDAYKEYEYNEYDEDVRSAPDERHILGELSIQNVPISSNERTRRQTVVLPEETGKSKRRGGQLSKDFEEILISGKLMGLFPKDQKIKYIDDFKNSTKLSNDESIKKWINFRFPNPVSSFYLIFYTLELFLEDTERKIKTSAYLPEFISYFFSMKQYADELILLCETTNHDNLVDRFKDIRRIGSIFNLLFHSFPYLDNGEESIRELLNTEKSYDFSRITMNLIYQYAGTVEYDKQQIKEIEKNAKILLKTDAWDSFTKNTGKNVTSDMFDLFQGYDNSTILISLGSVDLSLKNSVEDMRDELNRFRDNSIYKSNLTMDALWNPGEKAEAKRINYNKHQDSMFHKFLSNLKRYNEHIFQWQKKDVLNNISYIKSTDLLSNKRVEPEKARDTRKRPSYSMPKSLTQAIAVNAGGRKTRRKRK